MYPNLNIFANIALCFVLAASLGTAFLTTKVSAFNWLYVSDSIRPQEYNLSIICNSTDVGSSRLSSVVFV